MKKAQLEYINGKAMFVHEVALFCRTLRGTVDADGEPFWYIDEEFVYANKCFDGSAISYVYLNGEPVTHEDIKEVRGEPRINNWRRIIRRWRITMMAKKGVFTPYQLRMLAAGCKTDSLTPKGQRLADEELPF